MSVDDHLMSDGDIVDLVPHRHRMRLAFGVAATSIFALVLVSDVISAVIRPSCPPGWTSWNLEPGLAIFIAVPVTLLMIVSAVLAFRARGEHTVHHRGPPLATSFTALLVFLAGAMLVLFIYGIVAQTANPSLGCVTF
jgi:hypothetical protein